MDPRVPERPASEREPLPTPRADEPTSREPSNADLPPPPESNPLLPSSSPPPALGADRAQPPAFPPSSSETPGATPPSRRRRGRLVAIVAAAVILLAGGAATAGFLLIRGSSEELLQLVPASSDVVATAYLDPSAGQKMNLLALAHRFPALGTDQELRRRVNTAIDEALQDSGLTHDDVLPWLGPEVAIAVDLGSDGQDVTTSVLLASTDDAAAEAALTKGMTAAIGNEQTREYRGVRMHVFGSGSSLTTYAIVDHVVIISNQEVGLTRVIDVSEETAPDLGSDPAFEDTVSTLPTDKLGLFYVNPTDLIDQALSASGLGSEVGAAPGLDTVRALEGFGMSVSAEPDGLAFDVTVRFDPSKLDPATREQLDEPVHENAMLSFVPGDSHAVVTQQGFDTTLRQLLDEALSTPMGERLRQRLGVDDALDALTGDAVIEIGPGTGSTPIGGAIVLGVNDPSAIQRTLDGLADLALASQQRAHASSPFIVSRHRSNRRPTQFSLKPEPKVTWRTTTYEGTTIRYLDDPSLSGSGFLPAYAVVDGAAMIGSSPAEIRKLIDVSVGQPSIMSSSKYTQAIARVPKSGSTFYVDVEGIVSQFATALPSDIEANLEPIKSVVAGGTTSSSRVTQRLFIEIR
jgi:hypothetical protein